MAKGPAREWVWLVCTETGDQNYRTQVHATTKKNGTDEVFSKVTKEDAAQN